VLTPYYQDADASPAIKRKNPSVCWVSGYPHCTPLIRLGGFLDASREHRQPSALPSADHSDHRIEEVRVRHYKHFSPAEKVDLAAPVT
jgi:hypothetical protein